MPYLEGVGSVVDIRDGHIASILCALAVRFTQLEGFSLQLQQHTVIYAFLGTQMGAPLLLKLSNHLVTRPSLPSIK